MDTPREDGETTQKKLKSLDVVTFECVLAIWAARTQAAKLNGRFSRLILSQHKLMSPF